MDSGRKEAGGFTLLDGTALVIGAAVASVHVRAAVPGGLPIGAWALVWLTFAGVALTAAGPFVFLGRRLVRKAPGYPRVGDWLWAMLGLPWDLTAVARSLSPVHRPEPWVATGLSLGLAATSLVAMAVVWRAWVLPTPEQIRQAGPTPWTNRVGLILSVAWPLQCGFGLMLIEGAS